MPHSLRCADGPCVTRIAYTYTSFTLLLLAATLRLIRPTLRRRVRHIHQAGRQDHASRRVMEMRINNQIKIPICNTITSLGNDTYREGIRSSIKYKCYNTASATHVRAILLLHTYNSNTRYSTQDFTALRYLPLVHTQSCLLVSDDLHRGIFMQVPALHLSRLGVLVVHVLDDELDPLFLGQPQGHVEVMRVRVVVHAC